jgi:hypothetical protein
LTEALGYVTGGHGPDQRTEAGTLAAAQKTSREVILLNQVDRLRTELAQATARIETLEMEAAEMRAVLEHALRPNLEQVDRLKDTRKGFNEAQALLLMKKAHRLKEQWALPRAVLGGGEGRARG